MAPPDDRDDRGDEGRDLRLLLRRRRGEGDDGGEGEDELRTSPTSFSDDDDDAGRGSDSDDGDYNEDECEGYDDDGYDEEEDCNEEGDEDHEGGKDGRWIAGGEWKQHLLALLVAIAAAATSHAGMHGGYGKWRAALAEDWYAVRGKFPRRNGEGRGGGAHDAHYDPDALAAPSFDLVRPPSASPRSKRADAGGSGEEGGGAEGGEGGHARARGWRRTSGLTFCPKGAEGGGGGFLSLTDRRAAEAEALTGACRRTTRVL